MGLIEAILIGIQLKGLEKPLVFFSMLTGLVVFFLFGLLILAAGVEAFLAGKGLLPSIGFSFISVFFFVLAAICGYFIKRCIK